MREKADTTSVISPSPVALICSQKVVKSLVLKDKKILTLQHLIDERYNPPALLLPTVLVNIIVVVVYR